MRAVFWISAWLVVYTYAGYPLFLWLLSLLRRAVTVQRAIEPNVSIIIAVRNEEANLPRKLENLRALDYPKDRIQIVIVSNGSTDGTAKILRKELAPVQFVDLPEACGKAIAINEGVRSSTGEILVLLDARQLVDKSAIHALVRCFADKKVGAVSGQLILEQEDNASPNGALGIYWKIEKTIRQLESATGSMIGVTGAIYAIRRELFTQMPPGTLLDDLFVPMCVTRMGRRVIMQPEAIARDWIFVEKRREFSRKVRTLTGNYQLLRLLPWLLSPQNPLLFRFVSHKLLRLLVPCLLILMLISSGLSATLEMRVFFWMQIAFYALAALGGINSLAVKLRPAAIANTFVILNLAAVVAFFNFILGRDQVWG